MTATPLEPAAVRRGLTAFLEAQLAGATDVDVADVAVGTRVEMTFRRLSTADGIHNYFWKARPARA